MQQLCYVAPFQSASNATGIYVTRTCDSLLEMFVVPLRYFSYRHLTDDLTLVGMDRQHSRL